MRRSISRIVADRALAAPDAVVVVAEDRTLTARQLDDAATGMAHDLVRAGVRHDDLVTVTLPNGADFIIACAAVWRAGATPQPLSPLLTDADRAAVESAARPRAAIGASPRSAGIAWIATVQAAAGSGSLPDLAASSWMAAATSGSTGVPKVVRATASARFEPVVRAVPLLPASAVQLVAAPMTHAAVFSHTFGGLIVGHRLVIQRRFDEQDWLGAVQAHSATWAMLLPSMMHRLLRLPAARRGRERLAGLETILHLGARCAPDLKRAFLEWAGPERVLEVYTGAESNGLTMIRGDEWLDHPGSVGRPVHGTEIQTRTPRGLAGPGQPGAVWLRRGATPAYSYLGTQSARESSGWDTLGDVGWIDERGYLYLIDRIDEVIHRGGERIHPIEVERVLESHPAVRSAVAFGLPDEEWGQRVAAVVDIARSALSPAELRTWALSRLGARAPAVVRLVRKPVRNDAGKTSRREWARRFGAVVH